jgi:DNA adenine methylase
VSKPTRPLLRYHGGKWKLAPWIIGRFPPHRTYCEPFGGAGSVLMRKPVSFAEVYNDVDDRLVNVFRVLRDLAKSEQLRRLLSLTPFARAEFEGAYLEDTDDDVERARRTIIMSFMGFGSDSIGRGYRTGFRGKSNRSNTTPAHDWSNYPAAVRSFHERLTGVVIEQQQAIDVLLKYDEHDTLHYVDPPYVHVTRSASVGRHGYRHELTDEQHRSLAAVLHTLRGMVVLSGYACPLYQELYPDWHRIETATFADGAHPRIETLWLNKAAAAAQRQHEMPMEQRA